MGSDIYVDFVELTRVRAELQSLLAALIDLRDRRATPVGADSTGSADVADAIDRFRTRWGTASERIVANLSSCADYVDLALGQYAETERSLSSALEGAAPTSGSVAP